MFDSVWDVASAATVFTLGGVLALRFGRKFKITGLLALLLYSWHTVFCITYLIYSFHHTCDSQLYYEHSATSSGDLGTSFVFYFTSFLHHSLSLSYLSAFLVFNVAGAIGLLAFAGVIAEAVAGKSILVQRIGLLFVMLPSASFWSSAIGKDAIAFLAVNLVLWASLAFKGRVLSLIVGIIAMFLVRPHVAAVLVCALGASTLFSARIPMSRRMLLGCAAIVGMAIVVPVAINYIGLSDAASVSDVSDFVSQHQSQNFAGGSSIDISSMSLPMQLFAYLFRPLPIEANNIWSFLSSIDNVILLTAALFGFFRVLRLGLLLVFRRDAFLWIYALVLWLVLALTTANLGIAVRQKWMFVPVLVYLCLSITQRSRVAKKRIIHRTMELSS